MRILRLTPAVEQRLMEERESRDVRARRVAARIVRDVRHRGDAALTDWTRKLDGVDLRQNGMWVSPREMAAAQSEVGARFLGAVGRMARNVRRVAEHQLPQPWSVPVEPGVTIAQVVRPLDAVGCYIPGGRFPLVSTLIMTVVPARVAGVRRIVVASPKPATEILAAASLLGITQVARLGGAQAMAALAYGTRTIARVNKIFGPGNRFVTAAKQLVSSDCAIDMPAGPTEALFLAARGNPSWIAADMLAQAEHAPDAVSLLVTTSGGLARRVKTEIAAQLSRLPQSNPAHVSMRRAASILVARSVSSACAFANRFAPEHLSLADERAASVDALLEQVQSAGTVFLGAWAAQPLGDYASGSNHVLPTNGWAHTRGGLSASDFVKCISVQSISRDGFERLAGTVETLARAEGLAAHANAIEVRRSLCR